jgi:hypothetical protein
MPQVGIQCVRGKMSYEDCAECSKNPLHPCGIPKPMLNLLQPHPSPTNEPDHDSFTPSRLLGCFREPYLKNLEPYYQDVDYAYSSLRGTTLHSGMDALGWNSGMQVITEKRLHVKVNTKYGPQEFSAQPDAIVVTNIESNEFGPTLVEVDIYDWKSREIDHDLTEADTKHRAQVWMYAWIISQTPMQWFGMAVEVRIRSVNICYFGSSKSRMFSSLGPGRARGKRIPQTKPYQYEELTLAQIPTQDLQRVGAFVRRMIEAKIEARKIVPAALTGDDSKWCFRCSVFAACKRFGEEAREVKTEEAA